MAGQNGDPRHHTQKMAKQLQDTITHLREDVKKVDEPQLKAMFETSAEVLTASSRRSRITSRRTKPRGANSAA